MKKALTLFCFACLCFSSAVFAQKQIQAQSASKPVSYLAMKEKTTGVTVPASKNYKPGFESSDEFKKLYATEGPYSFVNPAAEIFDKRDLTTKHFKCNDGTVTAVSSAGAVHYQKNGVWNTILNDVSPSTTYAGFGYANTYNRFQTYYGNSLQNGVRVITENNQQLDLMQNAAVVYLDANKQQIGTAGAIGGSVKNVNNENITYQNLYAGVSAHIEHNAAGYELNYELDNLNWMNMPANTAYVSFAEGVKVPAGYHAYLEKENTILVIKNDAGDVLLKYKAPHFYERNKTSESGKLNGRYATEEKNGLIYIHVLVDAAWLTDAGRKFPLIIDPVVTVTPNNAAYWTFTVDEDNGCQYDPNNDADDNLRVGFDDGNFDNDYFQCYTKYNISSIPDNSCFVNYSYCRWFQYNFTNDQLNDNELEFFYQAYDPIASDPVVLSCDQNYADINATGTAYRLYNASTNYQAFNGWHDFEQLDVKARVQAALTYDFVAFSLDNANQGGHSDPIGPSNDEWIDFRGHSNTNRPQLIINYEEPYIAATSVTASPATTVCAGTTVTLTRFNGTTGTNGNWGWYAGSTFIQYTNGSINVTPSGTTTYCVRGENGCGNTTCTPITITVQSLSVAATSITGTNIICEGGSTTLSVSGGSLGTGASWRWYTAGCGSTLAGTGASLSVSPTTTTTYYVRAEGTCNNTACVQRTVTVNTISTAPGSVSVTNSTICNGQSTQLTANGGSLGTGGVYRWYSGSCGGTLVGTGVSITPSPAVTTTYYVRAEDPSPCNTLTACASATVTVNQPSVAPTGISGTTTICNGGSTTLTVVGGSLGTGNSWNWYSGGCGGTFVGTGTSVTVSPTTSTTYFVRAEGLAPCPVVTACVSQLVTVNTLSTDPVSVSGTTTICEGNSTTLTVVGGSLGTGGVWTWYAGGCGSGSAVATGATVTLTPTASTSYYVRAEGTCNTSNCAFTPVTVNDSSVVASSITGSAAVCIGSSTNLTAVGGILGVGATWNWYSSSCGGVPEGTGSTITVSPTVATTYYLRAEGLCNTTVCIPFTVNVNPLPNGSISGSVTVCNGVDTAITFNFAVGTAPFTVVYTDGTNVFTKNNVNDGDTANVLPANTTTYTIQQITDNNGCIRNTGFLGAATVTVAPLPVVNNVSVQDVLCNGGNTGAITITASNGTPAYTYSNDNGLTYQSNNVFTGLIAGTYPLFIQDALACVSNPVYNVIVGEPAVLTHTATPQNASCDNVFDGTITVSVSGGVTPYTYSLNGGPTQPGNVFNGLAAGTYTVLVTDDNACTNSSTVTIDTAYAVYASLVSQTPVSCFGGVDGTVTVELTGGVPPYAYSINGVQFVSSPTFTGLASGNYVVTLRDSKGCTDFVNVTITQPSQLQAQIDSVFNIGCNGASSGAIYITVSGGNPTYNFLWSNGAITEDVTGLVAGTYNVAITDSKGCTASVGATISQPLPLFLNIASYRDLLCYNDSSGTIDITANGGVPPYSFVWSNGETTEDIYGLVPGTYSATVTDANGCQETISQSIVEPTQLASTISSTQVLCAGGANGSVDLDVTGGTTPYNYVWNNGAITQDLAAVSGGTYTVVIYDANGCSIVNSTIVTEAPPITLSVSVTNVLCNGAATGSVTLTVNGGVSPYDYTWSNGASTQNLTGLTAGTYEVTVKDANNCTATISATVTQPSAMVMNSSVVSVGCAGGADGSVDITVQGGVFPYTYSWSNGAVTEDINNVSGGTFDVTVTDANLCTITATFTITEPTAITSSVAGTDVTCNGANNGEADLTVSGGTTPYNFLWSTFQGSEDISGLDGGLYYVIITDANGCEKKDSVFIDEPTALVLTTVVTNISCFNANDGAIDLTVTGGSPAYTYAWSNGPTTQDLSSLPGGLYVVTVTDTQNCTATTSATIVNPTAIYANFIVKNPLCNGDTTGRIDLIGSGGTPPYVYAWSNGATTEDLINLGAGTYVVTITDSRNCSFVDSAVVTEPGQIFTSGVVKNVTCYGLADGFVDITAYAGTLPYSYLWSTGQSTEDIFNIPGGNYYVTVTDANGCQAVSLYIITEPQPLGISLVKTDVTCYGAATGTLAVIPTGGSRPYYYLWNTFDTDSSLAGITAGHYVVQLTDSNGCFIYDSIDVNQPTEIRISGVVTDAVCFGSSTGSIDVTVSGGTTAYTFSWSDGSTTEDLNNVSAGPYILTVTDANGCLKTATFTVGEGVQIISNLSSYDPICHGGNTGSATAITTGGVQPYVYAWSNTKTSISIGNLVAGTYTLTVTDAESCTATASVLVNDPAPILVTANAQNAKCFNVANGTVAIGVTGGFAPYTYLLNGNGQASDSGSIVFNNLPADDYLLIVTDVNGCQGTANFTVASPGQITVDLQVTEQVILTGMNTQLIATATSTVPVVNYYWSPDSLPNPVFDYSLCGDPTNCPNPYVAPRTTTTFTVTVMNSDSCYASDTVTVQVLNQPSAFLPTAFTPNGDGMNDRFEFDILGAINIDVEVYDRWGQRIYANPSQVNGINNQNGWDGTLNGKPAPFDTYVYQLKVTYFDNVTKAFSGTVTLMKQTPKSPKGT